MKISILFVLLSLALVSCHKDEAPDSDNSDLTGSWVNPVYTDSLITYQRAPGLIENQYGITFFAGNTLVSRQNSGWCGTPPITTADYPGNFTREGSRLNITVGYWGGMSFQTWEIIAVDNRKLVVYVANSVFRQGK